MIKLENWEVLGVVCVKKNYGGLIFYRKAVPK